MGGPRADLLEQYILFLCEINNNIPIGKFALTTLKRKEKETKKGKGCNTQIQYHTRDFSLQSPSPHQLATSPFLFPLFFYPSVPFHSSLFSCHWHSGISAVWWLLILPPHFPPQVLFVQAVCCGIVPHPRGFPPCEVPRRKLALTDTQVNQWLPLSTLCRPTTRLAMPARAPPTPADPL